MSRVRIVLPTRNEESGIESMIRKVVNGFTKYDYEILIVDDGDDNTSQIVRQMSESNSRIKLIHRIGTARNGLGGALWAGFTAPGLGDDDVIIMMDSDGQHPVSAAVQMFESIEFNDVDVSMGSRYINGGSPGGLDGGYRLFVSTTFRMIPRAVFPKLLRKTDPLGGLLAFRKRVLPESLDCSSWKVAMAILLMGQYKTYTEIPYEFQSREAGESKASMSEGIKFLKHVYKLAKQYYSIKIINRTTQEA